MWPHPLVGPHCRHEQRPVTTDSYPLHWPSCGSVCPSTLGKRSMKRTQLSPSAYRWKRVHQSSFLRSVVGRSIRPPPFQSHTPLTVRSCPLSSEATTDEAAQLSARSSMLRGAGGHTGTHHPFRAGLGSRYTAARMSSWAQNAFKLYSPARSATSRSKPI